ncbi:uncharacterized protein ColSpa_11209 [Colletotrichum spaethianum]|uniref:Uncharacterized protein n=1 Tax=Colletotrichum spaethianum TaxID=700344 RepID=A0AA37PF29_9PEZI|nr:uncharacterized protein ColSpa_11209 [Colletotrichum spaethianum]GKT51028.1 hypothetical protein ColSpa_11209 [Colletotrichum spaethianum]
MVFHFDPLLLRLFNSKIHQYHVPNMLRDFAIVVSKLNAFDLLLIVQVNDVDIVFLEEPRSFVAVAEISGPRCPESSDMASDSSSVDKQEPVGCVLVALSLVLKPVDDRVSIDADIAWILQPVDKPRVWTQVRFYTTPVLIVEAPKEVTNLAINGPSQRAIRNLTIDFSSEDVESVVAAEVHLIVMLKEESQHSFHEE